MSQSQTIDYIAVLDFGSQYAHLIARRVRELNVLAKIFTPDMPVSAYKNAKGIILSGGPKSTIDDSAVVYDPGLFKLGVPVLGLCYGHQLIAKHFGGQVSKGVTKEYGQAKLNITEQTDLFKGTNKTETVWMSHWDVVTKAPVDFQVIGTTPDCAVAAMANKSQKIWSCQFHLEVNHTVHGLMILKNFVYDICRAKAKWNIQAIEHNIIRELKQQAGTKRNVFLLMSGGVDSTVAFALLEKALGKKRVYGLHIDNGFMRLKESTKVAVALKRAGFTNMHVLDASARFLRAGQGLVDPEQKRQKIGELFIEIANEEMGKLPLNDYLLGQGTIYPDTIESGGTQHADKIKTHHNRIDLIQTMINQGKIIEPLKDLYKDEVRAIGKRLKIAKSLLERHPFPGPGLAIRTLCSTGDNNVNDEQEINGQLKKIITKFVETHGNLPRGKAGASLQARVLPMKSVGVQGDERSYKHPVVITGKATWQQLNELSIRITNEVFAVNRVLWHVETRHGVSLRDAQMHERYLTQDRLNLLRVADDIVMRTIKQEKIINNIWQFPVVLVPFGHKQTGGESIVLRPIQSQEAMTVNFYPMPRTILSNIVKQLKKIPYIDYVFYDITNKPPATIEWE
ncbi:MAG: glutamine-hydrolyzing GMP synthase [Patescibacteria group bacterium]|jgi:GMP synthase (glutamine-hydrolysing)